MLRKRCYPLETRKTRLHFCLRLAVAPGYGNAGTATSSCSDFPSLATGRVGRLVEPIAPALVSKAIVKRSGTATLNRRATGFAAGAFFLLLTAT
jgi:hypothetical protein